MKSGNNATVIQKRSGDVRKSFHQLAMLTRLHAGNHVRFRLRQDLDQQIARRIANFALHLDQHSIAGLARPPKPGTVPALELFLIA